MTQISNKKLFANFPYFIMLRAVWRYIDGYKKAYTLSLLTMSLALAIWLTQPYVMGKLFDVLQKGLQSKQTLHQALWLIGLLFLIEGVPWLLHGPGRVIERQVAFYARQNFVDDSYRKLQKIPYAWHQNFHSGQLFDRVRKAESALENFGANQFRYLGLIANFFGPVIALTFLFPVFGLLCILFCCAAGFIITRFDDHLIPIYKASNKLAHDYAGVFSDYMANIRTIITLRLGKPTQRELLHRYEARKPGQWREYRLNEWKWACIFQMSSSLTVSLIAMAVFGIHFNLITLKIGSLVMLIQYLDRFSRVFFDIGGIYQEVVKQATDYQSTLIIEQAFKEHVQATQEDSPLSPDQDWQQIQIKNIRFAYQDTQSRPHALVDISFDIKAHDKIAVIGTSGSGKSTLMTLLRGLYKAECGQAVIDGVEHSLESLADITTLIPQDPEIFENTIRYNITFGVEHSDDEIMHSCRIAGFDKVLAQLPDGLESDIREKGVNLSGGQKQRLALARGVFAIQQSSLILLDEPTSSVDTLTEMRIFDRLFKEFADKAMIASVHRLHLLPRFNHIIMMEEGCIVEQGNFDTLLQQSGLFAKVWQEYQAGQKSHSRHK